MAETYVWVYRTPTHMLMVKRHPFSYKYETADPTTGLVYVNVLPGTQMPLPSWDWVRRGRGFAYAGLGDFVYDISDLI